MMDGKAADSAAERTRPLRLIWTEYPTFFDLRRAHGTGTLIYVIGETHHCYIGCIGGRYGKQGLKTRYQSQYVDRAKAIFGLDESAGQKSFCAPVDDPTVILQVEALVQQRFIAAHGRENALFQFRPPYPMRALTLDNQGSPPSFLRAA
jgi:hypothetical protein